MRPAAVVPLVDCCADIAPSGQHPAVLGMVEADPTCARSYVVNSVHLVLPECGEKDPGRAGQEPDRGTKKPAANFRLPTGHAGLTSEQVLSGW